MTRVKAGFCLVFVNVHVTISLAATLNVATLVVTLPVLLLSSQVILVRSQPARVASVEV